MEMDRPASVPVLVGRLWTTRVADPRLSGESSDARRVGKRHGTRRWRARRPQPDARGAEYRLTQHTGRADCVKCDRTAAASLDANHLRIVHAGSIAELNGRYDGVPAVCAIPRSMPVRGKLALPWRLSSPWWIVSAAIVRSAPAPKGAVALCGERLRSFLLGKLWK
jgi:hypothetical protein